MTNQQWDNIQQWGQGFGEEAYEVLTPLARARMDAYEARHRAAEAKAAEAVRAIRAKLAAWPQANGLSLSAASGRPAWRELPEVAVELLLSGPNGLRLYRSPLGGIYDLQADCHYLGASLETLPA